MNGQFAAALAVGLVALVAAGVGTLGLRRGHTVADFYVASRAVTPSRNAAAIGGEYLSAASFLGVAGLILVYGYDALWYPVGYTVGYLVLLVVVAAPLRRSGAFTLPDFAQIRLGSPSVRRMSSVLVVLIGWLYLVPQLSGAALTLSTQTGAPGWLGGALVCLVVLLSVAAGGMRSITFSQAVLFWLKFTALLVPALVLLTLWRRDGDTVGTGYPTARSDVTVTLASETAVHSPVLGTLDIVGTLDGAAVRGPVTVTVGAHVLGSGTVVVLHPGDVVPVIDRLPARTSAQWLQPLGSGIDHPLYATLSLILAICLGTMGLPHVLVRFYTNPDGREARRTTLIVVVLLSGFYLLPTVFGILGRAFVPDLLLTGQSDATVLLLPERMFPGWPGIALGAVVTAGAFAAFLSTASGLTVSVAGVLAQDFFPQGRKVLRHSRIGAFRVGAVLAVGIPYVLSLFGRNLSLAAVVGLAFAVAASTFCPLLVLGVWWPRLTPAGAVAGLLVGGGLATSAVLVTITLPLPAGWAATLLAQPAAWSVPIAFLVMVVVSLSTSHSIPPGVGRVMARLHLPEAPAGEPGSGERL
ncbi:Na+(H+)/acetate symporter ActP [Nakamurella sp. UYEF19]|uniref:sodium/solute symporter n=1 Tax=Nakamurella sp. UYEF19 TaxID=1756392 RepID=UPI00339559D9